MLRKYFALAPLFVLGAAHAAPFTPGNVVIYRVGDGSTALINTGNAVFLDEYTTGGTLVQSVPMPTTASGANSGFFASGTATSEGLMTLSADGRYIMATGYASTAATSLSGTTGAAVNRVVGRIDLNGNIDTSTKLTDFASGNNPRGIASTNGTDIWVAGGAGGVRYTTLGATTSTQLSTTVTNIRGVQISNGQLYVSDNSGTAVRLGAVGSGTPTTAGQTIVNLSGFPTAGSPYQFFFADLDSGVAGNDTLYVAEDTTGGGQIQKYSLVAGNWTAAGSISAAGVRGLTGYVTGTTVSLFATTGASTATGGGTLYSFSDGTGYNGTASGTATNAFSLAVNSNEAFRGIVYIPLAAIPEPGTLALLGLAPLAALLLRRRK